MFGGFSRRKKVCPFKRRGIKKIDYKDLQTLKNFITPEGRIVPSRITGVSNIMQRELAKKIKLARYLGLLIYCDGHNTH